MITIYSITGGQKRRGNYRQMPCMSQISPRQHEVWKLVCEGKQNKTIAHELGISMATTKVHVRQLMFKTNTTNRVELVRLAATEGRL